uniref:EF-hand domain-containing protein n=1 Tax=Mesocestoides corti TaxID=53468 RepID=A0A5K3FKT8_MESCO
FRPIISRINQFIKYKGIVLRECYRDFDPLNSGKVNENQFFRNFPGPADINEAEICALAKRYSVPNRPGMVDYRRLENDIIDLDQAEKVAKHGVPIVEKNPDTHIFDKTELETPSVQQLLERIAFVAYRQGIRFRDFFRDFDPLRRNEVTEHQFNLVLGRALERSVKLQPTDIQKLANYFRSKKNKFMISYQGFCEEVDLPLHEMDLCKAPLVQPLVPNTGATSRPLQALSEDDEVKVSETIKRLRTKVRSERIPTYQYFQDFDAGTALTQVVTPNQMARIFSFLKLDVTWEECQRLSRKFADAATDLVNYAALCQAIDPFCKIAKRVKCYADADPQPQPPPRIGEFPKPRDRANWDALSTPKALSVGDNVPADVLMSRIRHLVLVNRIQLKKYFEDFDNLRSGRVSRSQFERALSVAGITRVGMHDLTPAQVETLANAYAWTPDPSRVNWRRFVGDVDAVFTAPEIEQNPLCQVVPSATFVAPKPGTGDWDSATEEMKDRCGCAMRHLRRNITERRVDMKPEFQAFDKINRGHVKVHNFKQIISSLRFHLPDDPNDVRWKDFCDEIELIFSTPLLEKDPLKQPDVYQSESAVSRNHLPTEVAEAADRAIKKIGNRVGLTSSALCMQLEL